MFEGGWGGGGGEGRGGCGINYALAFRRRSGGVVSVNLNRKVVGSSHQLTNMLCP